MNRYVSRRAIGAIACTAPLLLLSMGCAVTPPPAAAPSAAGADWRAYVGGPASNHYSTLNQIHKGNVARLQVAWTYETGDKGEFQTNNLIVDGVLYTASPSRNVIALNAATGKELWRFDPRTEREDIVGNRQRGLVYWEARGRASSDSSAAVLHVRPEHRGSIATWRRAGRRTGAVRTFGDNGSIHLGQGMGIDDKTPPTIRLNTPGVIYKDLLIIGGLVREAIAGSIRAFDVRTGRAEVGLPHDSAPGRVRLRHLAARRVEDGRRRLGLVRPFGRREARDRLRVHRNGRPRLLGRRPVRGEPVRQFGHRARREHGQAPVALPDRPPRPVGSGSAGAADAAHGHAQRAAHRCGRAGHEARPAVRLRSRHRRSRCGRFTSARRHGRRFPELQDVADAAGPGEAGRR